MTADRPPVALLAALEEESRALAAHLEQSRLPSPGLSIREGELDGMPLVLVTAGVGKVAAAMASQFVCDAYKPRLLLSFGLAGATEDESTRGQVIIGSGSLQHDMDARPLASSRGAIPGLGLTVFPADPTVAAWLRRAAEKVVGDAQRVRTGLILTGDQIVTSRETRDGLIADFPDGACFDMETAAVAQVARQNRVAWGALRVTSDAADENFDLDDVIRFGAGTAASMFDRIIRTALMDVVPS
jgi:adenosylhomocysteine nucleosidase